MEAAKSASPWTITDVLRVHSGLESVFGVMGAHQVIQKLGNGETVRASSVLSGSIGPKPIF